tara:strand:- start:3158 stop:3454 length:297 start_codon:yes stop_codon:yes gene_type:complete
MRWLDGLEVALLSVMGHLKDIAVWVARAENVMVPQSCRTPPAFRTVITAWSLVLAPMVEVLTGSSLAAVQCNLAWMEARKLIREITGQVPEVVGGVAR